MFNQSVQDLLDAIATFFDQASKKIQLGNQEVAQIANLNEVRKSLGDLEVQLTQLKDYDEFPYDDEDDPPPPFNGDDFLIPNE